MSMKENNSNEEKYKQEVKRGDRAPDAHVNRGMWLHIEIPLCLGILGTPAHKLPLGLYPVGAGVCHSPLRGSRQEQPPISILRLSTAPAESPALDFVNNHTLWQDMSACVGRNVQTQPNVKD